MACIMSQTARRTLLRQVNSPIDAYYNHVRVFSRMIPCETKPGKLWEAKVKLSFFIDDGVVKYGRCDVTGDQFLTAMAKEALELSIGSEVEEGVSWLTMEYLLLKLDLEACDATDRMGNFVIDSFYKTIS